MDVLKRELQRKRQLLDTDFGGRKLLRRSEIQRPELQRLRAAERRRLQQKLQFHPATPSSASPSTVTDSHEIQGDHPSDTKESLPREEVIWRLRLLQPATLFGEGDAARLRRLHAVLEDPAAVADVDASEIGEGQTNDFLRDIQALRAAAAKAAAKPKEVGTQEDGKEEEAAFEELCDEAPNASPSETRSARKPQVRRPPPPLRASASALQPQRFTVGAAQEIPNASPSTARRDHAGSRHRASHRRGPRGGAGAGAAPSASAPPPLPWPVGPLARRLRICLLAAM